jgi:hypothetical protein
MNVPGIPEPVELVRDFKELRELMTVWVCPPDGTKQRFVCIAQIGAICNCRPKGPPCLEIGTAWEILPSDIDGLGIGPHMVEKGWVYRVVDELLTQPGTTAERTRKKVRT